MVTFVLDLLDDFIGEVSGLTGTVPGASEVIDHYFGAPGAQQERVLLPETVPGTRHHRYTTVETQLIHPSRNSKPKWNKTNKRRTLRKLLDRSHNKYYLGVKVHKVVITDLFQITYPDLHESQSH